MHPYFHIFSLEVPAYGCMLALGVLVAGAWGLRRVCAANLRWDEAVAMIGCGVGTGLLGAALLYLLVTYPAAEIWHAIFTGQPVGLVFYGGLMGAVPGVLLCAKVLGARLDAYVPPLLPCLPLGHAIGRVGCLLAGCCYGAPTTSPLGVWYPYGLFDAPTDTALLPVPLMESACLLAITIILALCAARAWTPRRLMGAYAVMYAVCRFLLEFLRYDAYRGLWAGLSTSQWISLALLPAGLLMLRRAAR